MVSYEFANSCCENHPHLVNCMHCMAANIGCYTAINLTLVGRCGIVLVPVIDRAVSLLNEHV